MISDPQLLHRPTGRTEYWREPWRTEQISNPTNSGPATVSHNHPSLLVHGARTADRRALSAGRLMMLSWPFDVQVAEGSAGSPGSFHPRRCPPRPASRETL